MVMINIKQTKLNMSVMTIPMSDDHEYKVLCDSKYSLDYPLIFFISGVARY